MILSTYPLIFLYYSLLSILQLTVELLSLFLPKRYIKKALLCHSAFYGVMLHATSIQLRASPFFTVYNVACMLVTQLLSEIITSTDIICPMPQISLIHFTSRSYTDFEASIFTLATSCLQATTTYQTSKSTSCYLKIKNVYTLFMNRTIFSIQAGMFIQTVKNFGQKFILFTKFVCIYKDLASQAIVILNTVFPSRLRLMQ